eukprot:TRINITY_DN7365_c0_g1_i1.p1 TRINITY_DN7365_c0_g1~~TRINITY_DN7365_c0_g1_i1.p1  ORF type:complete len:800 (-),score=133.91 TRINITY_DN7365_c0_g1_i1:834-3233(-)
MSDIGDDDLADLLAGVDDSEDDDSDTDAFLDDLEKPETLPQAGADREHINKQTTSEEELADILGDASDASDASEDSDERDAKPPLRAPPPLPSLPASLPDSLPKKADLVRPSLLDPPETEALNRREELAELLADFDDSSNGSDSSSNDEALPEHSPAPPPPPPPPPPEEMHDEQNTARPLHDTVAFTGNTSFCQERATMQEEPEDESDGAPRAVVHQEQQKVHQESTPRQQLPLKAVRREQSAEDIAALPSSRHEVDLEALCKLSEIEHHLNLQNLQLCSLRLNSAQFLPASLTSLCLSGNAFEDMGELAEQLSPLTCLVELDLSRCRLTRLPEFPRLPCLVHLDISKNSLLSCVGLYKCSSLLRLSLSRNRLHHLEQLEMLLRLEELDASQNHLGPKTQALRNVAACTKLRAMWVEGNPLAKDKSYRGMLLSLFPSLVLLDDKLVRPQRLPAHKPAAKGKANSKATKVQGCELGSWRNVTSYSLLARGLQAQVQQPRRPAAREDACKGGASDQEPKRPPRYTKPTKSSKLMRQAKYEPDSEAEQQEYAFGSRFSPPVREPAKVSAKSRLHRANSKADRRGDTGSSPTKEQPRPALLDGLGLHPQTLGLVPPLPKLNSISDGGPSRTPSVPGLQSQDSGEPASQSPLLHTNVRSPRNSSAPEAQPSLACSMQPTLTSQLHPPASFSTFLDEKRRLLQQVGAAPPATKTSLAPSEQTMVPQVHTEPGLAALLSEKRRLLQQVSAKLGGGVVSAVLGHGAEPVASSPGNPNEEADEFNSLRDKLRGGIDRKRALLSELQRS